MSVRNDRWQIGADDIRRRLEGQSQSGYLDKLNVKWGAISVLGVYAGMEIGTAFSGPEQTARWVFFVATCLIALIPVATYRRGLLFHTRRENVLDELLPDLMTICEILFFIALPRGGLLGMPFPQVWFWLVSAHAATACALVLNRLCLLREADFEEQVAPAFREYRRQIAADAVGALCFALVAGGLAWAQAPLLAMDAGIGFMGYAPRVVEVAAMAIGVAAIAVSVRAYRGRRVLAQMLDSAE